MKVRHIKLIKMDVFAYMAGDEATRTCALIDPAFQIVRILNETIELGYKVTHVINTHGHSDHIAGNKQVIAATGAKLFIHESGAALLGKTWVKIYTRILGGKGSPRPDVLLKDGDVIRIGQSTLKVIHTPGHTKGCICLYTEGHVFTGDALFVGNIGRTDFGRPAMLRLAESIKSKLYVLPDDTIVWPGHDYGDTPSSTIAQERETNPGTIKI